MLNKIVLGIDLGTSAVKILAVDQSGEVIASQEKKYKTIREGVQVEQNPEDWWQAVKAGIKELNVVKEKVTALAMAGQLNGLVLVDQKGRVLRNAIIWLDRRAADQAQYLNQKYGDSIQNYSYSLAGPIYNLSKLQWLKENEAKKLKNTYKILFAKDYITYKLTGQFVTDVSDAGAALMLDLKKRKWPKKMLEKIIPLNKLPELSVKLMFSVSHFSFLSKYFLNLFSISEYPHSPASVTYLNSCSKLPLPAVALFNSNTIKSPFSSNA